MRPPARWGALWEAAPEAEVAAVAVAVASRGGEWGPRVLVWRLRPPAPGTCGLRAACRVPVLGEGAWAVRA